MKTNPNLKTNLKTSKPERLRPPKLRFTPTAWAKLLFLRDRGPTEVGGFGIATSGDLLLVHDLRLIDQECSSITVAFDDRAVAEFFDEQVDQGLRPAQFARIWVHTHPGNCAFPSHTDEATFARAFGQTDWSVMFILAEGGQTYCRLEYHLNPASALELEVEVDYRQPFCASDHEAWEAEYLAKVHELVRVSPNIEPGMTRLARDEDFIHANDVLRSVLVPGGWDDDEPLRWGDNLYDFDDRDD